MSRPTDNMLHLVPKEISDTRFILQLEDSFNRHGLVVKIRMVPLTEKHTYEEAVKIALSQAGEQGITLEFEGKDYECRKFLGGVHKGDFRLRMFEMEVKSQ